jgi:hypothetical protein
VPSLTDLVQKLYANDFESIFTDQELRERRLYQTFPFSISLQLVDERLESVFVFLHQHQVFLPGHVTNHSA